MGKHITYITFAVYALQVCSCALYQSEFPITDSVSSTINTNWTGKWVVMDENELFLFPIVEVNLQAFNEKEYVATVKHYENKGREINSVETYKVHNSISTCEYLNVRNLNDKNNNYSFYKIEEYLTDSVFVRYLTDTLEIKFKSSKDLGKFLEGEDSKPDNEFLSKSILFFRWNSLNWNRINKQNSTSKFDKFWVLGDIDEDYFMKLSGESLEELVANKQEIQIEKIQAYFNEIKLTTQAKRFWKVPSYGLIKMKSGEFIKLKFSLHGSIVKDLSNGFVYKNRNRKKWEF